MDKYSKWGIGPDDMGGPVKEVVSARGMMPGDFDARWGTAAPPPAQQPKKFGLMDTWPAKLAQSAVSFAQAPGQAVAGKFTRTPEVPGQWSDADEAAQQIMDRQMASRASEGAMFVMPSMRQLTTTRNALIDAAGGVSRETAQLAAMARDKFGIPVRGGQISESPSIRFLDSALNRMPLSGHAKSSAAQQSAFNSAVAAQIGENATSITPQLLKEAKKRLGQQYETIAEQTGAMAADDVFKNSLAKIYNDARVNVPDKAEAIKNRIMEIAKAFENGELSGQSFKGLIRKKGPVDARMTNDGAVGHYIGELRGALNDLMSRHAPNDLTKFLKATNSQYANVKAIEPLAKKASTGDISPAALMGRARDSGELYDLARIGQRFLKEPASSGTAERLWWGGLLGGLGGTPLGLAMYDPAMAMKAAALSGASTLGGMAAGAMLRRPGYANRLIEAGLGQSSPRVIDTVAQAAVPRSMPLILTHQP